jgi:hypothetical protein
MAQVRKPVCQKACLSVAHNVPRQSEQQVPLLRRLALHRHHCPAALALLRVQHRQRSRRVALDVLHSAASACRQTLNPMP